MSTNKTNCVYCGLPAYGSGCRFAPKGIHVHSTPNKCMYCGLLNIGFGCKYSPSKKHVRFGDFGFINNESTPLNSSLAGLLIKELAKPITTHKAFELGIVDSNGDQIKKPTTEKEKNAYNLYESIIIELKKQINISNIINENIFISTINANEEFNSQKYKQELELKEDIEYIIKQLYNTVDKYKDTLSKNKIEQCIIEGFIDNDKQ